MVALWLAQAGVGYATTASLAIDLTTLSLEELMGVEVTLAARKIFFRRPPRSLC